MNAQRLQELTERADKAKKLAAEIADFNSAKGEVCRMKSLCHWNNGTELLNREQVQEAMNAGIASVISSKEAELESLLNPPNDVPRIVMNPLGKCYMGERDRETAELCS